MRLAPFIVANTEPILAAWEAFARTILPAAKMAALALRDHAADLLLATVRDMDSAQSATQTADTGEADNSDARALTVRLNGAPEEHAIGRLDSGFNLMQLVSEYRALRASVLSLWHANLPSANAASVGDLALFNASIDQSLATAVKCYTKRVDESRDMFLAILSHDLRNPLNSIAMSAHLLPRANKLDAESTEFAAQIASSAGVMAKMIGDLLDYTRTRLGAGMPINRGPTDLAAVAREVVAEFRSASPDAVIRLDVAGDLAGDWDAARLRQVLSNLLGNAIQHGEPAAPVEVALDGTGADVSVAVRNRGARIPAGELPKIFDPLVRGAASQEPRRNRPGSIGLGLYIARELVVAHGGTIGVTSTAEGGTAFTFHLPRHARVVPVTHPGASLSDA